MKKFKLSSIISAGVLVSGLAVSMTATVANAQSNYGNNAYVTVYEDCDFRGTSRNVDIGEYRSLKTLRFANDRMSSIKVPPGMSVTIFEHDNYGGAYATIDRDIACFDRTWNDQVSSMRVTYDRRDSRPIGERGRGNGPRVGNDNRRDEVRRNERPRQVQQPRDSQNRTIRNECFTFRAYTDGGNGGLRFHGKEDYYRFNRKPASARICHNGALTMEMTKTAPGTGVTVEIDGNRYRFAPNEREDELKNNWYRKYIRLRVGR
jgi:hypothetical protein